MPENSPIPEKERETPERQEKIQEIDVNAVNKAIVEQVRAVILLLLEKGWTKAEIGKRTGYSGNYISMIFNYKTFPQRAEEKIKLLQNFNKLLNEINREVKQDGF